jgi:hypothetical protein
MLPINDGKVDTKNCAQRCSAKNFSAILFFRDFSSVVRQRPGYNAKTGHGPHSLSGNVASRKCLSTAA